MRHRSRGEGAALGSRRLSPLGVTSAAGSHAEVVALRETIRPIEFATAASVGTRSLRSEARLGLGGTRDAGDRHPRLQRLSPNGRRRQPGGLGRAASRSSWSRAWDRRCQGWRGHTLRSPGAAHLQEIWRYTSERPGGLRFHTGPRPPLRERARTLLLWAPTTVPRPFSEQRRYPFRRGTGDLIQGSEPANAVVPAMRELGRPLQTTFSEGGTCLTTC